MIGKLFKVYGGANFNDSRILIVLDMLDERYVQYTSYCINDDIISIQRVNVVGIQRLIDNGHEIK